MGKPFFSLSILSFLSATMSFVVLQRARKTIPYEPSSISLRRCGSVRSALTRRDDCAEAVEGGRGRRRGEIGGKNTPHTSKPTDNSPRTDALPAPSSAASSSPVSAPPPPPAPSSQAFPPPSRGSPSHSRWRSRSSAPQQRAAPSRWRVGLLVRPSWRACAPARERLRRGPPLCRPTCSSSGVVRLWKE